MIHGLTTPTSKPLGISSQTNSPISTPKNSPNKKRLQTKMARASSTPTSANTSASAMTLSLNNLQNDYNNLERSYADLLLRSNSISIDKLQLEKDLQLKAEIIAEQSDKIVSYESIINSMKVEYGKNQELYEKELFYYKELVSDLELKINKLTKELDSIEPQVTQFDDNSAALEDISKKYKDLLRDFKVLQSNFEVEQSSKLVLMDQIEYITHEMDNNQKDKSNSVYDYKNESSNEFIGGDIENKEIHMDTFHTLNALHEQSDSESDSDNEVRGNHGRMLSLADEISSSSPIKDQDKEDKRNKRVTSVLHNPNFKFPPSPDPEDKQKQRQSLPAKLKTSSPHLDLEEFVLSPLKLTANHNGSSSSYFDLANASITKSERRYSNSKPHHSRYNSHDVFPITVEFEQLQSESGLRAASVPEKIHNTATEGRRNRNSAFLAEISIEEGQALNRNSMLTESSSKRSSLLMDQSILTNDMTKQEIMKLKFELQSLKLHNEKLLSYIGFELQKQKKNIKKLSHKQSLNSMRNNMEYSDAKLIEKSRDMLIHKKRVLRSVSINPIVSKRGEGSNNRSSQIISKGLLKKNENGTEGLLGFPYQLFDGEDEYGFLNEPNHGSRLFDNGIKNYYEIDEDIEEHEDGKLRGPKKYKSQIFRQSEAMLSDYDEDDDDLEAEEDDDSWQDVSEAEGTVSHKVPLNSVFNHIKGLFISNNTTNKHKNTNDTVDETLKYKFFTIAVGILIIGIRFSHNQNIHHQ